MRALVAEANVSTRITLKRILQRTGFDVDELYDELAAVCRLNNPEAPDLALLAMDTWVIDFSLVCEAMREARPSVYIVALVPEGRRPELTKLLSQGADDFMIKPINAHEAEARTTVIQRYLAKQGGHEAVFAAKPASEKPEEEVPVESTLEVLEARLSSTASTPKEPEDEAPSPEPDTADKKQAAPAAPAPVEQPSAIEATSKPTVKQKAPEEPVKDEEEEAPPDVDAKLTLPGLLSSVDLNAAILQALGKQRLGLTQEIDPVKAVKDPFYAGLMPLVVRKGDEAEWVNIRIDLDKQAADLLYRITKRKIVYSEQNMIAVLQETFQSVQEELEESIIRSSKLALYAPVIPIVARAEEIPSVSVLASKKAEAMTIGISFSRGIRVLCSVATQPVRMMERLITALRRLDVLASPIQADDDEVMLLSAGVLLRDDYIQKVKGFLHTHKLPRKVQVLRPPSGTAVFLYSHLEELELKHK